VQDNLSDLAVVFAPASHERLIPDPAFCNRDLDFRVAIRTPPLALPGINIKLGAWRVNNPANPSALIINSLILSIAETDTRWCEAKKKKKSKVGSTATYNLEYMRVLTSYWNSS
jgi:hypothetical protein